MAPSDTIAKKYSDHLLLQNYTFSLQEWCHSHSFQTFGLKTENEIKLLHIGYMKYKKHWNRKANLTYLSGDGH